MLPAGYVMRPPRLADGPAIVDMLNDESRALAGVATASLEWVTAPWTAPGADLERDFAVVTTRRGELAAYACVESEPPHTLVSGIGGVALAHHRRGLGAALVREIERRAHAFAERAPACEAVLLHVGALADEPRVAELLRAHGFVEARRFLSMRIEFERPPRPPEPLAGVELRPFAIADRHAVYACLAEAWQDHWGGPFESEERWVHHAIHASDGYDPALWRVAWQGDEVVGALAAEGRSDEDPELGYIALVGVRPAARWRGIGEALLRAAFAALAERGCRGAVLHVDSESPTGATRLYERVGMRPRPRFSEWEKTLRPGARSAERA